MPEPVKQPEPEALMLDPQRMRRRRYLIETRRFAEAEIEREEYVRREKRAATEAKMAGSRIHDTTEASWRKP